MKTLAIALWATCASYALLHAAVVEKQFAVLFETDQFYLDEKAQLVLNNIAQQVCNGNYYEITASGHTDNEGSLQYNEALSLKRVAEVKSYLVSKGIESELIISKWHGEKIPAVNNSSEQNKQQNRRVVLQVKQYEWKQAKDILTDLKPIEQEIIVSAKEQSTINSKAGIKIEIPENAFVTESGKLVSKGNVTIKIIDALNITDWLKNNLTTVADKGILQSGGMFKIEAFQNNEQLKLNPEKQLKVEVPYQQKQNGMSIFYANNTNDGNMTWENSNVPVIDENNNEDAPYLKLDTNEINLLVKHFATKKIPIPDVDSTFLKVPKMPTFKTVYPKSPVEPNKGEIANKISLSAKLFYSKRKRNELIEKEYARREKIYNEQLKLYNRRLNQYCKGYDKYETSLKDYIENKPLYEAQIKNGNAQLEKIIVAYFQGASLIAVQSELIKLKKTLRKEKIYNISYYSSLIKNITINTQFNFSSSVHKLPEKIKAMVKHQKYLGLYKNESWSDRIRSMNRIKQYSISSLLSNDKNFDNVFSTANDRLYQEKISFSGFNKEDLSGYYTASLSSFGWINIDKFYKQELTASLSIDMKENSQIYLIYKNINSIMSYAGNKMNVPDNEKVTVFSVAIINGKPFYAKEELTTKKYHHHQVKLQYKEGLLHDINKELQVI